MEAKQFKSLIKEAVREAVREELGLMLLEQLKSGTTPQQSQPLTEGRSMSFDSGDVHSVGMRSQMGNKMAEMFGMPAAGAGVKPQTQLKVDPTSDNPFAAFINDTAANLSPQEMRQMLQGG
jgi:hypothetical protein